MLLPKGGHHSISFVESSWAGHPVEVIADAICCKLKHIVIGHRRVAVLKSATGEAL